MTTIQPTQHEKNEWSRLAQRHYRVWLIDNEFPAVWE